MKNIYILGVVTVHKIHGSVRYDTVVSQFDTFSIRGAGNRLRRNVGNISVLNHEGEPMGITQALDCTRVCTCANSARFMLVNIINQSVHYKQKVEVKKE